MPKIKTKNPIDLDSLKSTLKEKIVAQHGSVYAFAKSGIPEKYELLGSNIPIYLSPKGSISFKALKMLCALLGVGQLKREVKIVKTVAYFL